MVPINYAKEIDSYFERKNARKIETRDFANSDLKQPQDWMMLSLLGRLSSATGITVTAQTVMGVATVFACIRVRTEAMASLPLILYKGDGQSGVVEARDCSLYSLLRDAPNSEMSAYDFIATMEGHLSLRQNAYAEIMRDGDGDPVGLYPIDPRDLQITRDARSLELYYQFTRNGTRFPMKDILHLRGYSRSGLVGIDMSTNLQEVFALALALQDNAAKFFGNGSRPGAVVEHPATMSPDAVIRFGQQIDAATSGNNAYKTLVLEEGAKFAKIRSENKDSQFQEAREYQDLQICRVFKVPPHKVGIMSGQPRANIEEENISFVTDAMLPNCTNYEKALNMKLLSLEQRDQGYHFKFQLDELTRGNMTARYDGYSKGRQWGFLSVNDIRRRENMNPVGPDGDMYLQPSNMVPLGTKPGPVAAEVEKGEPKDSEDDTSGDPKDRTAPKAPAAKQVVSGSGGIAAPKDPPLVVVEPPGKSKKITVLEDTIIQ